MRKFYVQIGNINGQFNYQVVAESTKDARQKAIEKHKEYGREMKDSYGVYVIYRGRIEI